MSEKPILVGAVVYDPKVTVIWEIIRRFFEDRGVPMDTVYYTNYELQNRALIEGHLEVAWNSPLAWLDAQRLSGGTCRAIAMRDTDRDRVSHLLVRSDAGIGSIEALRGRTIAFGAMDSPQANLIPKGFFLRHGMTPGKDYRELRFDVLVGKHGDHIGGEKDALMALQSGKADACWCLDLNWQLWSGDGTADPSKLEVLATSEPFDHCVFTVRADFPPSDEARFLEVLFAMSYDNPEHREMMDMEGLKKWEPGRTTGFGPLGHAVEALGYWK
jgi:ABC-type phosphate/phosphonate transport system substrate-binding protein